MSFQFTLGIVLAFFVPGTLALVAVRHFSQSLQTLFASFIAAPSTEGGLVLFVASLVCGVLIDTARVAVIDTVIANRLSPALQRFDRRNDKTEPVEIPRHSRQSRSYLASLNHDNLQVFVMLIEKTHDYYRLAANTFAAVCMLLVGQAYAYGASTLEATIKLIAIAMLTLVALLAAIRNHQSSNWAMREFARSTEKRECAKDFPA